MSELKAETIVPQGTTITLQMYPKAEADKVIAELKDKIQQKDFFWEGCGFAKRGFKNTIAVSEAFDNLEAENRRLKRALYKACANWMIDRQCAMSCFHLEARAKKFDKAIDKCRAKAEEYK